MLKNWGTSKRGCWSTTSNTYKSLRQLCKVLHSVVHLNTNIIALYTLWYTQQKLVESSTIYKILWKLCMSAQPNVGNLNILMDEIGWKGTWTEVVIHWNNCLAYTCKSVEYMINCKSHDLILFIVLLSKLLIKTTQPYHPVCYY